MEKRVKDLIRPLNQCIVVREDDTIRDVLGMLGKTRGANRTPCLMVVGPGEKGQETIKGFVTPHEVVFGLTTRFLKGAEKSGPIFWEGQLAAECLEGLGRPVAEIMTPIKACARENEMLMEAVFLLFKSGERFLPVANKEEMVGTIHMDDILMEIVELTSDKQDAVPGGSDPGKH